MQKPSTHCELACGSAQACPHAPQSVSVLSGVSQPLAPSPSQLSQPSEQVGVHAPATQAVVP